jgi:DNA-binding NarL/FixJ family response regulator
MVKERRRIGVLVVSDLLLPRAALRQLLVQLGFDVPGEAANTAEAIALAAERRPDVTLVDLDASLDAHALADQLMSLAERSRVIVLSDRNHATEHAQLLDIGASGLVLKNDPPETLQKAICKVHAGEIWLDRAATAELVTRLSRRRRTEDAEDAKIEALTRREHEIVALVGEGLKNAAIAERLFISEATVRNHLTSIFEKLDLADRFELAVYAFRHGLVPSPHVVSARRSSSS